MAGFATFVVGVWNTVAGLSAGCPLRTAICLPMLSIFAMSGSVTAAIAFSNSVSGFPSFVTLLPFPAPAAA